MIRNGTSFFRTTNLRGFTALGFAMLLVVKSLGQVPDAPPPAAPASSSGAPGATSQAPAPKPSSGFLGRDVPAFDPSTEVLNWDGKNWNVNNNRLFQMRFEKYLNAPEATSEEDRQYQAIITEILNRLAPGAANTANMDYAFRLLRRGSNYDIDARLCDALADAVYTVWSAQRQQQRLLLANDGMMHEIQLLELATKGQINASQHAQAAREKTKTPGGKKNGANALPEGGVTNESNDVKQAAVESGNWQTRRLGEMIGRQKANDIKRELSEIAAKVEYQALIVQFFLQRRFQHVLMATRFYRAIFNDGDTKLNLGKESKELFTKTAGMAPTVTTLDSLANEVIRDVREGVKAFEYLLESNELESGTKRLAEAFAPGEYMPEIRTLSRVKKRKTLVFAQKANQLISALDVKDYGLAEKLVKEIEPIAKDFDPSKPMAAIESTKKIAHFRLAKARNAALSGDRQTLETELAAATELWPRNPELEEISQKIFSQGDVQQQGISDFDQLYGQKNYRQIFDNSARFIVATSLYPDRQGQLKQVMQDMQTIEAAILRSEEMRRQNNYAGAWESVEKVATQFPGDSKLNQARADLTTQAADFVRTLRSAQDLEKKAQTGSSLSWFLKAQKLYPASDFAHDGIDRLKKKIFPSE
ncbi:MAG: hypothetical protein JWL90_1498 [Chthoniobacteraceae bacterium]|nr:hypothetical protein [Chthoniobacteraceae bacterium]